MTQRIRLAVVAALALGLTACRGGCGEPDEEGAAPVLDLALEIHAASLDGADALAACLADNGLTAGDVEDLMQEIARSPTLSREYRRATTSGEGPDE